jgi:hypothetical protein
MQQALFRQWSQIPMANTVLEKRRNAGLLGLGQGEASQEVLLARQKELAEIRAERKAIEAETTRIKARIKARTSAAGTSIHPTPAPALAPASQVSFQSKINWNYVLIGGAAAALIWAKYKR